MNDNAVIVDRENKTFQTKVASISWKNQNYQYTSRIFYKDSFTYSSSTTLQAEGLLSACQNCFMGKDYPYIITFNFIYSEGDGIKKPYSLPIELPIR